mmetsp:Transcript_99675/g.280188  ORF Transcript_99675/g.280188 Transcript_99675/m.280188 type:complete len:977 (+) Transcript_99675:59-2989(+)
MVVAHLWALLLACLAALACSGIASDEHSGGADSGGALRESAVLPDSALVEPIGFPDTQLAENAVAGVSYTTITDTNVKGTTEDPTCTTEDISPDVCGNGHTGDDAIRDCTAKCNILAACRGFVTHPWGGNLKSTMDKSRGCLVSRENFKWHEKDYFGAASRMAASTTKDVPFDPHAGLHSPFLVVTGLFLSLSAFLSSAILGMALLATLCDVSVPFLAVLPTGSAALLVLQLVAQTGRGISAGAHTADIARSLVWALPSTADVELVLCCAALLATWLARRAAVRQRRPEGVGRDGADGEGPHGLVRGAWELRVAGLLAFPLAASSIRVLSGDAALPIFSSILAAVVLFMLGHHVLMALKFVTEVVGEGRVLLASLPATAHGSEVFVDRICDQLLALPVSPPRPSCPLVFRDWLTSPAWCVAPAVAVIQQVEQSGPHTLDEEMDGKMQWPSGSPWCGSTEEVIREGDLEDEMQGRPLLRHGADRADSLQSAMSLEDEEVSPSSPSGPKGTSGTGALTSSTLGPPFKSRPPYRPSAVSLAHPVRVATRSAFDVRARELVAGVACIPWLDCAVPAGVLKHIDELRGGTVLQAHPGQLSGALTGGRFAACFDWGNRWPWRWPFEVALKASLGIWAAVPLDQAPIVLAGTLHVLILCLAAAFAHSMMTTWPYTHIYDNIAIVAASWVGVLIVLLRLCSGFAPALAYLLAIAAATTALVPCAFALLATLGLAGATLERLEAQAIQDRFLPRAIHGWGGLSGRRASSEGRVSEGAGGSLGSGCSLPPEGCSDRASEDEHSVEVILPGQRRAFAIVLPAMARPRIEHVQLLPPVAGRGGAAETLPACAAKGERARLPVPPSLLFPALDGSPEACAGGSASSSTGQGGGPAKVSRTATPLVALLVPGRPGCLIYADAAYNEGGSEWDEAIRQFFGFQGSLLAEAAERLVQEEEAKETDRALVVVEVLPAFAAEFMDERHAPPAGV